MKKMKKIFALLIAMVMVLGMSTMAFAATTGGSITLKNTVTKETYQVYKVFDASTGADGAVSYTVPQDADGNDIYTAADLATLFDTVNNGGKTYVTPKSTASDEDITTWASTHHETAVTTTANGNTGSDVTISNLGFGYYYIKSSLNNGSVIMVTSVSPDAVVYEKNSEPGWGDGGKTVENDDNSHTYTVGETISYKLSYENAANYGNGEKVTQYTITDTMPTGINLNTNSIAIKVTEADGTEHTIASADATSWNATATGFTIVIPWIDADAGEKEDAVSEDYFLYNAPATITVEYTAVMTSDAGVAEGDTNEAMIYPNTETDTHVPKTVDVSTGKITITKVDGADETKFLAATFVVQNSAQKYLAYDETNDTYSWVDSVDDATEYTTDATTGQVVISE